MKPEYVNIHTHLSTGHGIHLRTAGIHPWQAATEDVSSILPALDAVEAVDAVGEIGLDYASKVDRGVQMTAFRAQLRIAREQKLPVVLHCVRAFEPMMCELAACTPIAVIFHGFIGSPEQAQQATDKGYYLSFGERTFSSPKTIEAMRATPLERLFFETDDSPTPIETIYARAAELLGTHVEALQRATTENYERIFTHG